MGLTRVRVEFRFGIHNIHNISLYQKIQTLRNMPTGIIMVFLLPRHPIKVTLHPQDNFSGAKVFIGTPRMQNEGVLKKIVKMQGFHGNP